MGKSLRSKRMRKNRKVKRQRYGPKETERLKSALAYDYNEELKKKSHLSLFHDIMNGAPPSVPGLEKGSKLERTHLTEGNVSAERIDNFKARYLEKRIAKATSALKMGANYKTKVKEEDDAPMATMANPEEEENAMDSDADELRDENLIDKTGQYPVWMNKKKIQTLARNNRLRKAKEKRSRRKRAGKFRKIPADVVMKE